MSIHLARVRHFGESGSARSRPCVRSYARVFRQGEIPEGSTVAANLPVQLNPLNRWGDRSYRHTRVTIEIPELDPGQTMDVEGELGSPVEIRPEPPYPPLTGTILIDGVLAIDLADTSKQVGWCDGPLACECLFAGTASGIHVKGSVYYTSQREVRLVLDLGNTDWHRFEQRSFKISVDVSLDGKSLVKHEGIEAGFFPWQHQTRMWFAVIGEEGAQPSPVMMVARREDYGASIPLYDGDCGQDEVDYELARFERAPRAPGELGLYPTYMAHSGHDDDIGLLPRWEAALLSPATGELRHELVALSIGQTFLEDAYSIHARDFETGAPVSIRDHSTLSFGPMNEHAQPRDKITFAANATQPYVADTQHTPSIAYTAYMLSGEWFFYDALAFWANHCLIPQNPQYRGFDRGLVTHNALRGQAWSLRTLAQAALAEPDLEPWVGITPFKSHWIGFMQENLRVLDAIELPELGHYYSGSFKQQGPMAIDVVEASPSWNHDMLVTVLGWFADVAWERGESSQAYRVAHRLLEKFGRWPLRRVTSAPDYPIEDASPFQIPTAVKMPDGTTRQLETMAEIHEKLVANRITGPGTGWNHYGRNGYGAMLCAALAALSRHGICEPQLVDTMREVERFNGDLGDATWNFAAVPLA
jgi:hypothetical protein